jgi:hypothetical protein
MGLSRAGGSASVASVFARGTPQALALLRAAWPAAVGRELARRTEVLALEGSALRVRVPDLRWRKVLHRMQPEILKRLRDVAGDLVPRQLGFNEGPPGRPEPAPQPSDGLLCSELPSPLRGGEPAALPEGLAAAADAIEDPEIRSRFERSAARYLTRFRNA